MFVGVSARFQVVSHGFHNDRIKTVGAVFNCENFLSAYHQNLDNIHEF